MSVSGLYDFQVEDVEKLQHIKRVLIGNEMGTLPGRLTKLLH